MGWPQSLPTSLLVGGLLGGVLALATDCRPLSSDSPTLNLCQERDSLAMALSEDGIPWARLDSEPYEPATCAGTGCATFKEHRPLKGSGSLKATRLTREESVPGDEADIAHGPNLAVTQELPDQVCDMQPVGDARRLSRTLLGVASGVGMFLGFLLWGVAKILNQSPVSR